MCFELSAACCSTGRASVALDDKLVVSPCSGMAGRCLPLKRLPAGSTPVGMGDRNAGLNASGDLDAILARLEDVAAVLERDNLELSSMQKMPKIE